MVIYAKLARSSQLNCESGQIYWHSKVEAETQGYQGYNNLLQKVKAECQTLGLLYCSIFYYIIITSLIRSRGPAALGATMILPFCCLFTNQGQTQLPHR